MSADQISLFLDFAGQTDKHIAEIFLEVEYQTMLVEIGSMTNQRQNNGRDVERAVSAFFDNSDPGRYKNNQVCATTLSDVPEKRVSQMLNLA